MLSDSKPYLIGETAFHHEGDVDFLNELVDQGVNAGVDTIKFHLLFDIDDYIIKKHTARKKLEEIQIPTEYWGKLHNKLVKREIRPIYLCNDVASLRWVNDLENNTVEAIEIHATGINDYFLLQEAIDFEGPVILGSSGSSLDDIYFAIDFLRKKRKDDILLMHGFQNYPTDFRDINFSKMDILKNIFDLPVGYADHTDPANDLNLYISCLPQASGYNILEKHFTHVPNEERIDSQAAVSVEQLRKVRELMDKIYLTHGSDPLEMPKAEQKYGDTGPMKKAIVSRVEIQKGELVTLDKLAYKRTNTSTYIKQRQIFNVLGSRAICDIEKDEIIDYSKIKFKFQKRNFEEFKIDKK